jgi:putative glycosyltransferase (TIGR04372 family)
MFETKRFLNANNRSLLNPLIYFFRKAKKYGHKKVNRLLKRLAVTLANIVWGGEVRVAHMDQVRTFENSGVFASNRGVNLDWVYRQWAESERIWNLGSYHQSIEIKRQVMEHIYQKNAISGVHQVAPIMSTGWGVAIGHLGSLGAFILGQRLGVIPPVKRCLPFTTNENFNQFRKLVQDEIKPIPKLIDYSILEHPSQWSISERLQIINTNYGFLSLYEMHEHVYRGIPQDFSLKLDPIYIEVAREKLKEYGLPADAWFVGFHVRENRLPEDSRVAKIENFYPAIKEITRLGGWVIRFGTGLMKPLPKIPNVIDLNLDTTETRNLHIYILSACKFLLTTNSGPSVLAWSLGTPVLQTNTLSIGRNILSASRGSIYLPKIYSSESGKKLSLYEILISPEAYTETDLKQKFIGGYILEENSEHEILLAAKEMLTLDNSEGTLQKLDTRVDEIRHQAGAVGYGKIASSFLDENETWFLR